VKLLHNTCDPADGPQSATILERLFELGVVLTASMDAGLAERGLTPARAELLWQLQRQPKRTQRELSQLLRCTPRNVTDLVDTLEASGLVAREPHPTDRRATLVTLTRRGKSEVARMQAGSQALAGSLFAGLSLADLGTFETVLDLVLTRLGERATAGRMRSDPHRGTRAGYTTPPDRRVMAFDE
jgi:DNA-binding MarR family transcriptional regulator